MHATNCTSIQTYEDNYAPSCLYEVRLTIADVRRPVKSAGFHPSYGYRRPTLYRSRYTFTTHISTLKVLADPDSHKFRKFVKIFLLNFDPPSPSVDGKHVIISVSYFHFRLIGLWPHREKSGSSWILHFHI